MVRRIDAGLVIADPQRLLERWKSLLFASGYGIYDRLISLGGSRRTESAGTVLAAGEVRA
jgi:hypothetical protein